MKNLRHLFLWTAFLIALCIFPCISGAEEEKIAQVSVQTVEGEIGEVITVGISVSNAVRLDSIQFNLNYDSTALKPLSFTPGLVFTPEYCVLNLDETDRIRAACVNAYGTEREGEILEISFRILSETGSAITFSDVVATWVDDDYYQIPAYVMIENGGVSVNGHPLPEPKTTPWIAPTPVPTPTPEPTPTAVPEPIALPQDTPEPDLTPEPEPGPEETERNLIGYLAVAGLSLTVACVIIVVILMDHRKQKAVARKNQRNKKEES